MYKYFEILLLKSGKSVAEVCRKTGLQPNSISNWKKRGGLLSADSLLKLARYFGTTVEYLLTGANGEVTSQEGNKYCFDDSAAMLTEKLSKDKDLFLILDKLAAISEMDSQLINNYFALNKEGKARVSEYAHLLAEQPLYLEKNNRCEISAEEVG